MNKFSFDILHRLINKYYDSKLSKGGSTRNLRVALKLSDKELSTYSGRDSFKYIDDNDVALAALEKKNYIFVRRDLNGRLQKVELNPDAVEKIRAEIGIEDRDKVLSDLMDVFKKSDNKGFVTTFAEAETAYIAEKFTWHKSFYEDKKELAAVLKVLNAMVCQSEEVMERDFSVKNLGDSKAFASLRGKVVAIAKKYDKTLAVADDATTDEILLNYNIVKNSTYALIKGNLNFQLNGQIIRLSELGFEFSLSDLMIKEMNLLPSDFDKLITVENLTSFYRTNEDGAVVIFLSGFHNHTKQLLIQKIYGHYKISECLHTGDIDAGGFIIYNNLVQSTGVPFKPYKMGLDEIKRHLDCMKPLTDNDRKRLSDLLDDENYLVFSEVIKYMLDNNLKLEQESLD